MVSVLFFFISILLFTSILLAPVYVWKLIQKAGHPNAGHAKYQNTRTQGFTQNKNVGVAYTVPRVEYDNGQHSLSVIWQPHSNGHLRA
jgi:hypothetical protein